MAEENNQLAAALSKKLEKDSATAEAGNKADSKANSAGKADKADKRGTVLNIVEDATGIERDELEGSKRLGDDLNIDSLSLMDIAVRLEEEFGVEVPDEDINRVKTIDELVGLVDK
ncbi:acyl carrier protein [Corynebacterium sp. YSMAA1_1_F7]|uniref:acyl carrier protein n=1 Tax=Corynebacterium sp. YSMAA1_1_F7 TaxID=3383590 RepID=UPI0038CF651E